MEPKEFMERVLDVVDENTGDNSLRAIYFRMISEGKTTLRGETPGFKAIFEAIDTPSQSYLEARMRVDKELYVARLYIRREYCEFEEAMVWDGEPSANAQMLLRLYTVDRQREISYK